MPTNSTSWAEMMRISVAVSEFANIAYLVSEKTQHRKYIDFVLENDFKLIDLTIGNGKPSIFTKCRDIIKASKVNQNSPVALFFRKIITLTRCLFFHKVRVNKKILFINKLKNDLTFLLEDNHISSVVVFDDRTGNISLPLLKVCDEKNIRTIIPPIAYAAMPQSILAIRRHNPDYYLCGHSKLKSVMPHQYYYDSVSEQSIAFYRADILGAYQETGVLPKNPWVMGGGFSRQVLVDGEEAKLRYIEQGCSEEKITVTGHAAHDVLYENYRNREEHSETLRVKYSIGGELLVVMALPQMGEHGLLPWKEHWYEINYLGKVLQSHGIRALISLHPKMNRMQYQFLEDKYNQKIVDERLNDILPAADIFLSTFSSTLEWAVLCQIPSIVFDFYGLNYNCFDWMNGINVVNDKTLFEKKLYRLLHDKAYRLKLKENNKRDAMMISPFDGNCMSRIVKNILRGSA